MPWSTLPRILFWMVPDAGGAVEEEKTMDILHERVAGLDVHKNTVVACARIMTGKETTRECRTFATKTDGRLALRAWLSECQCRPVAMEATGGLRLARVKRPVEGERALLV